MNFSQADSVILAIPFVSLLAVFVFRLDAVLFRTTAKHAADRSQRPRFANFDSGSMVMTDPDGRLPEPQQGRSGYKHL